MNYPISRSQAHNDVINYNNIVELARTYHLQESIGSYENVDKALRVEWFDPH